MNRRVCLLLGSLLALAFGANAQIAETYLITDVTGWTSNQLVALPWFARWIPGSPPGAPLNFSPAARNGAGLVVGDRPATYPTLSKGAYVENGSTGFIDAWGGHSWSYWSCDSHDCHYYGVMSSTARPWMLMHWASSPDTPPSTRRTAPAPSITTNTPTFSIQPRA